ncbi:aldehyde dehydrogenase family protein [Mucilaginibacter sp. SMC90]|uniref:aldehyde dehydrogenase family protein n=1 Tax=Mucilaginibacter sp. SMC90 TaxID=2929803 RepID=UPI001FB4D9F3|nr:aldehyde dehydrogenase family protein [Mucilaginibacter sp. SMC90]UOE48846.1 aldehyde dehydrogenase family protein [Mucilaginibacter sp. SMC90]
MKTVNQILVDGKLIQPIGSETMPLYNPSTAEIIGEVRLGNEQDVELGVRAAKKAFKKHAVRSVEARSEILQKLHDAVLNREDELSEAAILEYGSPVTATRGRTKLAAQFFLDAKNALEEIKFETLFEKAAVIKEPLGVVAAITPWNADYIHICGKIAPALAAGCTIVIKPSEFNAIETQLLAECFISADIPAGLINIINGTGAVVGSALTRHPDVSMISFTGSTQTGRAIGKIAADTMKRTILELGGKSPNILLDDCDFESAIPRAIAISFSNSGQACHAGTRLIVPAHRLELVSKLLTQTVAGIKTGHLNDPSSSIGPMVNAQQFDRVQSYIQKGIDEGAKLLIGGLGHPDGLDGFYVKPTVFTNVTPDMVIAREEIFGPVLSVISYRTEEEAISIANDSIYGLSAYISSGDVARAQKLSRQIESGRVIINGIINTETRTPFGGFKQSGIGRTGWSYGIEMHLEPKVIAWS